jgi:endonuclease/exonuclease/phosphatase family metal-dependent hydrolase
MSILRGIIITVFLLALGGQGEAQEAQNGRVLDLMTFNIRYAHTTPPDLWPDRRPVVREMIEMLRPDIIGSQEGLYPQLIDMEDDLPAYAWIGLGRDGGSRGEFMAIYYLRDRFVPLEYDHFWLSDTPEVIGSRSWGNRINRMVTWVRFQERSTGCHFYVVNTHFDHESQPAREASARLLLDRARDFEPALPVLLLGDFNAAAGENPVYDLLVEGDAFVDTWRALRLPEPELGTFHGFRGVEGARGRGRIDWILTRGPVTTLSSEIVTFARGTQYPSDHFPVTARVRLESCQ